MSSLNLKSLQDEYDTWVYEYTISELQDMYRADLRVNRNRLEVASAQQATFFEKWYSAQEEVDGDIRDKKDELARVRAKANLKVRKLYPNLKESGVNAKVQLSKKVRKCESDLRNLQRYYSCLRSAVEAAKQRKSMIQVLKDLYISNYWDKTSPQGVPRYERRQTRIKKA